MEGRSKEREDEGQPVEGGSKPKTYIKETRYLRFCVLKVRVTVTVDAASRHLRISLYLLFHEWEDS